MLNKLPKDLLKYIDKFVNPTEDQLEYWKMCHYIEYYKVLNDITCVIWYRMLISNFANFIA